MTQRWHVPLILCVRDLWLRAPGKTVRAFATALSVAALPGPARPTRGTVLVLQRQTQPSVDGALPALDDVPNLQCLVGPVIA
jgi:hypothetical protein